MFFNFTLKFDYLNTNNRPLIKIKQMDTQQSMNTKYDNKLIKGLDHKLDCNFAMLIIKTQLHIRTMGISSWDYKCLLFAVIFNHGGSTCVRHFSISLPWI